MSEENNNEAQLNFALMGYNYVYFQDLIEDGYEQIYHKAENEMNKFFDYLNQTDNDNFKQKINYFKTLALNESTKEKKFCQDHSIPYYNGMVVLNKNYQSSNIKDIKELQQKMHVFFKKRNDKALRNTYTQYIGEALHDMGTGISSSLAKKEKEILKIITQRVIAELEEKLSSGESLTLDDFGYLITEANGYVAQFYADTFNKASSKTGKNLEKSVQNILDDYFNLNSLSELLQHARRIQSDTNYTTKLKKDIDIAASDFDKQFSSILNVLMGDSKIKKFFHQDYINIDFHSKTQANLGLSSEQMTKTLIRSIMQDKKSIIEIAGQSNGKDDIVGIDYGSIQISYNSEEFYNQMQEYLNNLQELITDKTQDNWVTLEQNFNEIYKKLSSSLNADKEHPLYIIHDSVKEYTTSYHDFKGPHGGTYSYDQFFPALEKQFSTVFGEKVLPKNELNFLKTAITNFAEQALNYNQDYRLLSLSAYLGLFVIGMLFDDGFQMITQLTRANDTLEINGVGSSGSNVQTLHLFTINGQTYGVSYIFYKIIALLENQIAQSIADVVDLSIYDNGAVYEKYKALKNESPYYKWSDVAKTANQKVKIKIKFLKEINAIIEHLDDLNYLYSPTKN